MSGAAARPFMHASAWMAGALFSFMAMAIAGRELAGELSVFEVLFFRSLIGLAVVSVLLSRAGWHQAVTRRFGRHFVRNTVHFAAQYGWFYALGFLPLATVVAIEFTTPIWTLFLAVLLLGEKLSPSRLVAVMFGIAGVLVILRPGLIPIGVPALAVLGSAIGYALTYTITKELLSTDRPLTVLFYMTLVQLPLGLLPALGDWVTPSAAHWPWLVAVGLTALTAHYCMSRALALADAMVVAPLDFLRLPLIALVGFLFYGEALDVFVLGGAALMFAGSLVNLRAERRALPAGRRSAS